MCSSYNRRDVLRKTAFIGGVASIGAVIPVSASSSISDNEVNEALETQAVGSIREAVPNLQTQNQRAEVVDGTSIIKVPTNVGELIIVPNSDGEQTALLNVTKHRPTLEKDWPRGTKGTYIGTRSGAVFRREATEGELEEISQAVDLEGETISVSKNTHTDSFELLERNEKENILQSHQIRPQFNAQSSSTTETKFSISDTQVWYNGSSVTTQAGCDDGCGEIAAQVVFCVGNLSCLACGVTAATPPLLVACWLASGCLTAGLLSEALIDAGCTELAQCVDTCW